MPRGKQKVEKEEEMREEEVEEVSGGACSSVSPDL